MSLKDRLYNLRRRPFGRYELDDPRPIAKANPYTFYLPPQAEIEALAPGDFVKLMFRSIPPGLELDAERMWVEVTEIDGAAFKGRLDNVPGDLPQLRLGDPVSFSAHHILDILWADLNLAERFRKPETQLWARCRVDRCVFDGQASVAFLYRETPTFAREGDAFPDSGWRIRGDYAGLSDEAVDAREVAYVALGLVLNKDDSFIDLLTSPVGSAFIRDPDTRAFVPEVR